MQMTYEAFLDSICNRVGFEGRDKAEVVATATLRVFGEVLLASDRDALADALPPVLRDALCSRPSDQDYDLEEFYERLADEEGLNAGKAREMGQVVGRVLARAIDGELTKRLKVRLPDEYRELFVNPHEAAKSPDRPLSHKAEANDRTLARGRAGSEKPVSESKPPAGQRGSVAAQENPYEETKISTGHESSEEDEETLAGGKPGSDRPVSDIHEE